jgi:hypothetical protein
MNATEFTTLSMTKLKSFCSNQGIEPVGDKRSKATWVAAIVTFENAQPAIEPPTSDPIHAQANRHREASIVALIAVLVIGTLLLVVKVGVASLAWAIAALTPLALGLWRYLLPAPTATEKIDYFPLLV